MDLTMRVRGQNRIYAVGDCLSFPGPKLGHMAVRQGEIAAENLTAEIEDRPLSVVNQSRFWGWAKRVHEQYWKARHG